MLTAPSMLDRPLYNPSHVQFDRPYVISVLDRANYRIYTHVSILPGASLACQEPPPYL